MPSAPGDSSDRAGEAGRGRPRPRLGLGGGLGAMRRKQRGANLCLGGGGLDLCDEGGSRNPHLGGGGGLRALQQREQEAKSNGSDASLSRTYGTESGCFEAPKQPVTV